MFRSYQSGFIGSRGFISNKTDNILYTYMIPFIFLQNMKHTRKRKLSCKTNTLLLRTIHYSLWKTNLNKYKYLINFNKLKVI